MIDPVLTRSMAPKRPSGRKDETHKYHNHRRATGVMNPLTPFESASRSESYRDHDGRNNPERSQMIFGQPGGLGSNQVSQLGRNCIKNRGGYGDSVNPKVPRREKSAHAAECAMRPDIKSALERHSPVEGDHHRSHRKIKQQHGRDPGYRLSPAQLCGNADPAASHHT